MRVKRVSVPVYRLSSSYQLRTFLPLSLHFLELTKMIYILLTVYSWQFA